MKKVTRSMNGRKWRQKTLKTASQTVASNTRCAHCTKESIASWRKGIYSRKKERKMD